MEEKRNLHGIDLMKFVAAMLVVAGHVRPFLSYSLTLDVFVIHVLARVTIQFFFMTAGYFLFRKIVFPLKENKQNGSVVFNYCKRVLILYAIWMSIYISVAFSFFVSQVGFSAYGFFIFYRMLEEGSHLWYLSALVVAVLLVYGTLRYLSFKKTLVIGFVLYMIGLFGDAYYGVAAQVGLGTVAKTYLDLFVTTRNGLFFGFFFMTMGAFIAKTGFSVKHPFRYFVVFMIALTAEVFLLRAYSKPLNFNLLFFALPASVCLFSGMLGIKLKDRRVYRWLRDGSLIVYLIHPLFMMVLPILLGLVGWGGIYKNSLVEYFLVAGGSYAFAWLLIQGTKRWPGLHVFY